MNNCRNCWFSMTQKMEDFLVKYISPLWDLSIRLYIFCMFFKAGWLKVDSALTGNWETTLYLFEYEYKTPFLSPQVAAFIGTFNEVVFSSFILVGLFTRLSAFALLSVVIIIEFTYQSNIMHMIWFLALTSLLIKGPGVLSFDTLIKKKKAEVLKK